MPYSLPLFDDLPNTDLIARHQNMMKNEVTDKKNHLLMIRQKN